ncbi:autotransporter domain-containing protein [Mesorhizobium sp. ANAO-SY3R2]|uniref:autotransporter outer membrane beta-barrel domain-containing protein n=1 Tax=Mesorhizobium sp. ANAO-SY3R2 TaxID=3166644 RepID=UPI00366EBC1E
MALATVPAVAGGGNGGAGGVNGIDAPGGLGGAGVGVAGGTGSNSSTGDGAGGGGGGRGANGGAGGNGFNSSPGAGGAGGVSPGASGANGSAGQKSPDSGGGGGGGGGGADGYTGSAAALSDTFGGNGGQGGNGGGPVGSDGSRYWGGGGGGGAGGYGALFQGNALLLNGSLRGGSGGAGGIGGSAKTSANSGGGGDGGDGGGGLVANSNLVLGVSYGIVIQGGDGGNGGAGGISTDPGFNFGGYGGDGGVGGVGAELGSGGRIVNQGTIAGGRGGTAGQGGSGLNPGQQGADGTAGLGGAGIVGSDLIVINDGTISGGLSGDGVTRAKAIAFTGGTNRLEVRAGSAINGKVSAFSAADTFALGGAANGTFDLSQLGAVGSGSEYQGFGILEKSGSGTWTISGTPGATMAFSVTGGVLDLGGNSQTASVFSLTGGELRNGTLSSNGVFDLQAGTVSMVLAGNGALRKSGAGVVTLTGDNSGFTGTSTVSGGKLLVGAGGTGALGGSMTVQSGGILGGSGTVGETVIQSGGILAPGNSIGTLHTGVLTYEAGAIHEVELADGGNAAGTHNDLTVASGLVTIDAGAVLRVRPVNGTDTGEFYDPGLKYTIITSTDRIDGSFGTLLDDYLFLDFVDSYDGKNVYLTSRLTDVSFCLAGSTANQCAASQAVQSSAPSALFSAIVNLTDAEVARAAFDQLSGDMHASTTGMLLQDSGFVRDAANDRLRSAFGQPTATSLPVLAYGEGGAELVGADTDRFAVWGNAFGSWGNNDGNGNTAAFDRSIGGVLMGGDTLVGDAWRVGLMTGLSHSSFDVDDRNASGDATSYYLGAYGGGQWGAASLRTGAAYSWNSIDTRRAVSFPGLSEVLSADYDAGTAQIFGEAAYRIDTAAASFEPFANLAYVNVHTDAFTETGGTAALSQASSNTDATFTTLGIRASGDFALGTVNATARGMVGWRHAFGDVTPFSTLAFANGDAFTVAGAPIARDAAVLEAGLDFDIAPKAKLGVSYTGQFGSGVSDNGAKLDLSIRF